MPVSYNGWVASTDPAAIGVEPFVVAGVSFPNGCRGGDVYTVFRWLAEQFHARIEPLRAGWCWGYEYRQNRNANNLSCHSSGTAIDFNAPNHPNGAQGTYSDQQVAVIRQLLDHLEGVVYWGGDFQGTVDEMHFEISTDNASEADIARVATKIRTESGPKEWPDMAMSDADKKWITNAIRVGTVQDIRQRDQRLAQIEKRSNAQFLALANAIAGIDGVNAAELNAALAKVEADLTAAIAADNAGGV